MNFAYNIVQIRCEKRIQDILEVVSNPKERIHCGRISLFYPMLSTNGDFVCKHVIVQVVHSNYPLR